MAAGRICADGDLMLVPARILQVVVEIGCQAVHPGQERLVAGQLLQPGHRDGAEQFERIALEPGPQCRGRCRRTGPGWPDARTIEVADQRTERLQRRRQLRSDGESSESLHGRNLAPPGGYLLPSATCPAEIDDAERAGGLDLA